MDDEESFDEQLTQLFEDLELRNTPGLCETAYDVLERLFSNIIQNPDDDRFRVLKKRNQVVQSKLLPCAGMLALITFLGFTALDQDNMIFKGDLANLEIAIVVARSRLPGLRDAMRRQDSRVQRRKPL
jgi:hypothetical protein